MHWYIATSGTARVNINTSNLDFTRWYHVAFVKDSSDVYDIYIDGIPATTTATYATSIDTGSTFYLGTNQGNGGQRMLGF